MSLGEALDELDKKNDLLVDAQLELAAVLDFATGESGRLDIKSAVAVLLRLSEATEDPWVGYAASSDS